ncbi:MAG: DUF3306 domain-containing protein [Hyphomonadaceae bacterium]|jgi:hypothetical protein|nr:DUF3306 domain-containing protein [Hyphomonadaceae bacterium]
MSDPEKFVTRWSRLKREAGGEKKQTSDAAQPQAPQLADAGAPPPEQGAPIAQGPVPGKPEKAAFDPASLPPIETITADSDIRAFLQSGVPAELTKAALRRVWATDPAIRDFIGIAENQWDFTDPTAIPGFGPLEATDDVGRLVAEAMGKLGEISEPSAGATGSPALGDLSASSAACPPPEEHASPQILGIPEENAPGDQTRNLVEDPNKTASIASQHADAAAKIEPAPNRRTHGGALPR